jgi:hypothetical protein
MASQTQTPHTVNDDSIQDFLAQDRYEVYRRDLLGDEPFPQFCCQRCGKELTMLWDVDQARMGEYRAIGAICLECFHLEDYPGCVMKMTEPTIPSVKHAIAKAETADDVKNQWMWNDSLDERQMYQSNLIRDRKNAVLLWHCQNCIAHLALLSRDGQIIGAVCPECFNPELFWSYFEHEDEQLQGEFF